MKLNQLVFIFAAILLTHCSSESPVQKYDSAVYGYLDNIEGKSIYLALQSPEGIIPIDTTIVAEDGYFEFSNRFDSMQVYRIIFDYNKKYLSIAGQKGDKIYIEADGNDIYNNYYVEGSPESELIKEVVDFTVNWGLQFDSIKTEISAATARKNGGKLAELFDAQKTLYANKNSFTLNFIREHPGSIAAYFELTSLADNEYPDYYELVYNNLSKAFPNFNFISNLAKIVQLNKTIQIGAVAPEMSFESPKGDTVSLTDLRGNYVLLDFWASWCKPCRIENPNLLAQYQLYHAKGLEIYGYSLDSEKEKWLAAIKQDQLPWIHTSDLKGWKAEGVSIYNVSMIPSSFLIDPEGVIIAKNLRGEQLEKKLKEIFK